MILLVNLVAGLLFGGGLVLSGMIDPAKVMNFLDVAGTWDPSLAFVMAGAVIVALIGFRLAAARSAPILVDRFHLSTETEIDGRLAIGATLFGIGWGLSGFCPGPAIASLGLLSSGTLVFVAAMLIGMALARPLGKPRRDMTDAPPASVAV